MGPYTRLSALAILASAVGVVATLAILRFVPNAAGILGPYPSPQHLRLSNLRAEGQAANASATPTAAGRYAIIFSPHVERDVFLLDTETGRVWAYEEYPNVEGKPTVWHYEPRLDNHADVRAFLSDDKGAGVDYHVDAKTDPADEAAANGDRSGDTCPSGDYESCLANMTPERRKLELAIMTDGERADLIRRHPTWAAPDPSPGFRLDKPSAPAK